jgi:hypothetical protein
VQCRHDFSEISLRNGLSNSESRIGNSQSESVFHDKNSSSSNNYDRSVRRSARKKSREEFSVEEEGSLGSCFTQHENGSFNDRMNISKTKTNSEGNLRNQYVVKPFHRVHLTGIINSAILSKLAEVLHELSKDNSSTSLFGDINDSHTASSSSSNNGAYHGNENYRNTSNNNKNGDCLTNKDRKLPDEKFFSRIDSTFLRPNYMVSSPLQNKKKRPLSSPMKFVVSNQPRIPIQFIQPKNPISNFSNIDPLHGNRNDRNNVMKENDGRIKSHRRDEGNEIPSGLSWIAKRRISNEPYFIVSTTAPPKLERFNYRIQNNDKGHVNNSTPSNEKKKPDGINVYNMDKSDENGIIIMGSKLPFHEIRWLRSPLAPSSSDKNKKNRADNGVINCKNDGEVRTEYYNTVKEEFVDNFDNDQGGMFIDKDKEHLRHKSGAKRKFNEKEIYYEAISGVDKQPIRLINIPHSKIVIEKNEVTDGAILKPLNEYEIFAPETLEDRERKKLSVKLFN